MTIVDNFSRNCYAFEVGQSLKGTDVVNIVNNITSKAGILPERIHVDNGSEFISKEFDKWAYENRVTLDYLRPGKPTDNPFIESFNGSFRDECLNTNWFLSSETLFIIVRFLGRRSMGISRVITECSELTSRAQRVI